MNNKDEPAYPVLDDCVITYHKELFYGITKREMFAMNAPEVPKWYDSNEKDIPKRFFAWRWFYADVMLMESNNE